MHEMVIVSRIIEEAKKQGSVKKIVVDVGELGHVTLEELWPIITNVADFEVELVEKPAVVHCKCSYRGSPQILVRGHDNCLYLCPECGEVPEIVEGGDIILKEVVLK